MRICALLPVALVALAACGGGDGGGDRLSAEELREQADAICVRYEQRLEGLDDPQNFEDLARFAGDAREALSDGLDDLRALEPPEELEEDYDAWLATGDDALSRIDELREAAEERDEPAVEELFSSAEAEDAKSDQLASAIGLDDCADD